MVAAGFLSQSELSFTILYNRKLNVLSVSLNKTFPSFIALGAVARVNQVIASILPEYINHGWEGR